MKEITVVVHWESTHTLTIDDDVDPDAFDLADDYVDHDEFSTVTPDTAEFIDWRVA